MRRLLLHLSLAAAAWSSATAANEPLTCSSKECHEKDHTALLQVSSDVTKRQSTPRRTATGHLHKLALTSKEDPEEKEEGNEEEESKDSKEGEHGRTHSMHLLVAVIAILIMIGLVIVAFQVDCFGQRKPKQAAYDDRTPAEARADTGDHSDPGCFSSLATKIYNTCFIRKRQASSDTQEVRHTKQSANFLLIASVLLLVAFLMAGLVCLIDYAFTTKKNFLGDPFPSGHNYFPQHIGDLLQSEGSARGTMFFAFCFTAGCSLLASWYPYRLSNCDVGDRAICCLGISWLTFRHLGITIALWLLCMVPTSRLAVAGYGGMWGEVTVYMHLLSFLIFCGGYILCEIHALYAPELSGRIGKKEWKTRMIFIGLCTFCFLAFELCGFADGIAQSAGACCNDVWIRPNGNHMKEAMAADHIPAIYKEVGADAETNQYLMIADSRVLYDTASGALLGLKVSQFVLQVYALIFLALSHLTIWFFSSARTVQPPSSSSQTSAREPVAIEQEGEVRGEVPPTNASQVSRGSASPTLPVFDKLPPRRTPPATNISMQSQPVASRPIVYERIPATSQEVYVQESPGYVQENYVTRPYNGAPTNVM